MRQTHIGLDATHVRHIWARGGPTGRATLYHQSLLYTHGTPAFASRSPGYPSPSLLGVTLCDRHISVWMRHMCDTYGLGVVRQVEPPCTTSPCHTPMVPPRLPVVRRGTPPPVS